MDNEIDRLKKFALDEWKSKIGENTFPVLDPYIEKWITGEIDGIARETHRIKKDSERMTALSVLFGKRLTKLAKLLHILKESELTDNAELFIRLSELI